jgi:hypothetical protein
MKPLTYFTAIVLLLSWFLSIQAEKSSESCEFPAIFNFGDSNSDTGSMSSAFYPAILPFGETFFHEAVGRASDGRLIIDFIGMLLYFSLLSFCNHNSVTSLSEILLERSEFLNLKFLTSIDD